MQIFLTSADDLPKGSQPPCFIQSKGRQRVEKIYNIISRPTRYEETVDTQRKILASLCTVLNERKLEQIYILNKGRIDQDFSY